MKAKSRLREWAIWKLEGAFVAPGGSTPLGRIKDDQMNAGASAGGFRYDIWEFEGNNYACMPDGGMFDTVIKYKGQLTRDQRCRDTGELVKELRHRQRSLWMVLRATFGGTHPRDVVKDARVAARTLGLKSDEYRARIEAVYNWIERRTGVTA